MQISKRLLIAKLSKEILDESSYDIKDNILLCNSSVKKNDLRYKLFNMKLIMDISMSSFILINSLIFCSFKALKLFLFSLLLNNSLNNMINLSIIILSFISRKIVSKILYNILSIIKLKIYLLSFLFSNFFI